MKKYIIMFAAVLLMSVLAGCGGSYINIKDDVVYVNVGDELNTDIGYYVKASKYMLEQMTLDLSSVDADTMGTYRAGVTYDDSTSYFDIVVTDLKSPEITLKSDSIYIEKSGVLSLSDIVKDIADISDYTYGFSDDMTLADQKKSMLDTLVFDGVGDYNAEIIAKDSYGNYSVTGFTVHVVESGEVPDDITVVTNYSKYMNLNKGKVLGQLDLYPSTATGYGIGNSVDSNTNRPNLTYYELLYGDYAVDFIQPQSSFVWLTFNEIIEYGNTTDILDTLQEKGVKAVFFITKSYAEKNPKLVQRMIDEGHVLGNYTATCADVTKLSVNELTNEIDTLYNYVYQTYGYEMYLFRAPSGSFTEQSLAVAQSLGYRTVFWSFAYKDWDVNAQPEIDVALQNAIDKAHGGAIYLLSASSSTNTKMLGKMIDGIRDKGLEFAIYQKN